MHVFIISGKARHGKDLTADILMDRLEGKSIKIAMADYLKFMAKKYYNWNGEKDKEGRTLLQKLGTERIRDGLGLDTFHVERVCQDIKIIEDIYDYVFIPDARFKNEVYYTQAKFPYSTTAIHVERLDFKSNLTDEQLKHRSENDLVDFDFDYNLKSKDGIENLKIEISEEMDDIIKDLNSKKFFKHYA